MGLFINQGMLGEVGGFQAQSFFPIDPHRVTPPAPNLRFFETLPTVWAAAYHFRQAIEQGDELARWEWLTLFVLHAMGVAYLSEPLTPVLLAREYPSALQPAMEMTYPHRGMLQEFQLLSVGTTTLGGVYPDVVFFPARARSRWLQENYLRPYLDGEHLSWKRTQALLLTDSVERDKCHRHLRCLARDVLPLGFGKLLDRLCDEAFGPPPYGLDQVSRYTSAPASWPLVREQPKPTELLEAYPLRKPNTRGGQTYFLVDKFPSPPAWMTTALGPGQPSPVSYRALGPHAIGVEVRGRLETLTLDARDEIVDLVSLFVSDYVGRVDYPRDDRRLSFIRPVHLLQGLTDASRVSVCMAPVTSQFLAYFPELLAEDRAGIQARLAFDGQQVVWTFQLCGREVTWTARYFEARDLSVASLSLWPPKVDPQWHFYAAHGLGVRERSGRWRLVDENGCLGELYELGASQDEYVTLLIPRDRTDASGAVIPNRPRALSWWWPSQGRNVERGVLWLSQLPTTGTQILASARLAVDFGTSNTSAAFAVGGVTDTLRFSLAPLRLWNSDGANRLGFAPFTWGGAKGYFSTTLLTRRTVPLREVSPEMLTVEHLFAAAIPNLYSDGLNRMMLAAGSGPNAWDLHDSLKWGQPQTSAYRALFLRLLLLFAHAELFFNRRAVVTEYTFTFPLAMSRTDRDVFHKQNRESIQVIQWLCHGVRNFDTASRYRADVDESAAAAAGANLPPSADRLDLFIDVGGGTTDIAVRRGTDILVLDSLRLAGRQFFRTAEQNLSLRVKLRKASVFRRHLGLLLAPGEEAAPAEMDVNDIPGLRDYHLSLPTFYLLRVNELKSETFVQREHLILKRQRDTTLAENQSYRDAYQRFCAQLFFRHILAYGIIQAAGAVVEQRLGRNQLPHGIHLVLGGNAWGLLLFADFERSGQALLAEAETLLERLKARASGTMLPEAAACLHDLHIHDVTLLNEGDISRAKTNVPIGALSVATGQTRSRRTAPFTGVNLVQVGLSDGVDERAPQSLNWFDRWSEADLKRRFGMETDTDIRQVTIRPPGANTPLDTLLTLFTSRGNTDLITEKKWTTINGYLTSGRHYPAMTPLAVFLTGVLYADPDLKLVTSLPDQPYPLIEDMARWAGFYDDQPPQRETPESRQGTRTYE
ncbi:MAG: rod shape-determining protein [Acidobacteriota bacterium]